MPLWVRLTPAILWMSVIFVLSHRTGEELKAFLPFIQKLFPWIIGFNAGHFAAFFILSITIYFALGHWGANGKGRLITVALCTVYGITDEFHQMFVDGRHPDLMDIRNDTIGAAAAMLLVSIPSLHVLYIKVFLRSPLTTKEENTKDL